MRKSLEDVFASSPIKRKRWNSFTPEQEESSTVSPQKIEDSFNRNLSKQNSYVESNISRYRHKSFQSKPTEIVSQDIYGSRKSSLNLAQQLLMMDSIEKGLSLFHNASSATTERPKLVKLKSISKTIEIKTEKERELVKQKEGRTMAERIEQLKQRRLKVRNQKLECNIKQDGKLAPLRLVLSNKVRNKIVNDLLSGSDQTKQNIEKILDRENEHEWLSDFSDLKKSLDFENQEKRKRHHKQLISRSTYNNVYYEFLALEAGQKKEYLKKSRSRKMMREEEEATVGSDNRMRVEDHEKEQQKAEEDSKRDPTMDSHNIRDLVVCSGSTSPMNRHNENQQYEERGW